MWDKRREVGKKIPKNEKYSLKAVLLYQEIIVETLGLEKIKNNKQQNNQWGGTDDFYTKQWCKFPNATCCFEGGPEALAPSLVPHQLSWALYN